MAFRLALMLLPDTHQQVTQGLLPGPGICGRRRCQKVLVEGPERAESWGFTHLLRARAVNARVPVCWQMLAEPARVLLLL